MNKKGFTLIELLIVIGIIAILAAVVIVALNPGRQFSQARNTQRSSNVNTILNAVGQYMADNNGVLPPYLASSTADQVVQICQTGVTLATCQSTKDGLSTPYLMYLPELTNSEIYLVSIPVSPQASTTSGTGYAVWRTSNNRVGIIAMDSELGVKITVKR